MPVVTPAYFFAAGLLLGAGVGGHALRLVVLSQDNEPDAQQRGRYAVAIAGMVLYGFAALLASLQHPLGLVITIVGPGVGVGAVLVLGAKVDRFQVVLGVFQLAAAVVSLGMLIFLWET